MIDRDNLLKKVTPVSEWVGQNIVVPDGIVVSHDILCEIVMIPGKKYFSEDLKVFFKRGVDSDRVFEVVSWRVIGALGECVSVNKQNIGRISVFFNKVLKVGFVPSKEFMLEYGDLSDGEVEWVLEELKGVRSLRGDGLGIGKVKS